MPVAVHFLAEAVHPNPSLTSHVPDAFLPNLMQIQLVTEENNARLQRSMILRANFTWMLLLLLNVDFALIDGLAGRSFAARISANPPLASPIGYNREEEAP